MSLANKNKTELIAIITASEAGSAIIELTNSHEAEIEALKASHKTEIEELNSAPDTAIEELKASHAEELAAKDEMIASLKSTHPEAKLQPEGTIKIGKKTIRLRKGRLKVYNLDGQVISCDEAIKDEALMKHLVEINSGIIEEVE
mgnify:CR=1 FL=1